MKGIDNHSNEEVKEEEAAHYHEDNKEEDPVNASLFTWNTINVSRLYRLEHHLTPTRCGRHHKEHHEAIYHVVEVKSSIQP